MKVRASGMLDVGSYTSTWGGDYANAEVSKGALTVEKLNTFLGEILYQPTWRATADIEADYYDSNQYDAETLSAMSAKGIPLIVVNLTAPAINMVLGLEAKTRTDWVVKPENDQFEDAAQAMSIKLKEAERMSGADIACSEAYAHQVKVGIGWVEVNVNKWNPFGYRYRVDFIHRREIWWDWHDEDPGLAKARYLVRRKWYDEDVACEYFPAHKDLILNSVRGWSSFNPTSLDTAPALYNNMEVERQFEWSDEEWKDGNRKRVCLFEVWYRTYERGFVIRYHSGEVKEFDEANPVQKAALMAGMAELEACVIPRMRLSYWMGPHRLADMETPLPHQDFPYVPFWGFREDRTGKPYGMIRAMRPLQDEVNARRAKMLWQLSAKTVVVDQDATGDHKKLQQEVARPDAYLKVNTFNGKRSIRDMIQIDDNSSLTTQQFQVYEDSKRTLQDAGGVYMEQLGKSGAADSGIAISQLIEQGTTTLAKINSNYQVARKLVGQRLLSLIVHDMKGKQESIKVSRFGEARKIRFNNPKTDQVTGRKYLDNDVTRMQMSVVLDDLPQTPTYRMQQFQQLTEMVRTLPEQAQLAVIDIVINASDIPDKQEVLARLRKTLGMGAKNPEDMSEEEMAEAQAQAQQAAQQQELERRNMEAEVRAKETKAGLQEAQTEKTLAETDAIKVEANLAPELGRHVIRPEPVGLGAMDRQSPQPQMNEV